MTKFGVIGPPRNTTILFRFGMSFFSWYGISESAGYAFRYSTLRSQMSDVTSHTKRPRPIDHP
jgi:hypothetical protein